jgi:hypothetical protein
MYFILRVLTTITRIKNGSLFLYYVSLGIITINHFEYAHYLDWIMI